MASLPPRAALPSLPCPFRWWLDALRGLGLWFGLGLGDQGEEVVGVDVVDDQLGCRSGIGRCLVPGFLGRHGGCGSRTPPVVVNAAVHGDGLKRPEHNWQLRAEQVRLRREMPGPHAGPPQDGRMPVEALDAGQEAVGERRFAIAVSGEAVVGLKLAEPGPADPPVPGLQGRVMVVAHSRRIGLGVMRAEHGPPSCPLPFPALRGFRSDDALK
jgi:hypothetical protein